jgi:hypothetical protein
MEWQEVFMWTLAIICILALTGALCYSSYQHRLMAYENFQKTISGLSDDQKCLHICGFQYPDTTYLENYKFCIEKCDRISERADGTK